MALSPIFPQIESATGELRVVEHERLKRNDPENLADITPENFAFEVGDIRRYGALSGEDCTEAIQRAVDVSAGGEVLLPEGDWIISGAGVELNYDQDTVEFCREAVSIRGCGSEKSRIIARVEDGPVFKHTQSSAQAAESSFAHGANFRDFSVLADDDTPDDCIGFQLAGMFSPVFTRVFIRGLTSHGIYCPYDGALGLPDSYGNAYLTIRDCTIIECEGWAVLISDGATTFNIINPLIISNLTGGVYGAGIQAARISGGGISYNGTAGLGGSCGIHIAYNADAGQTPHNWLIENCEIDRNHNHQLRIHGYNNRIIRNRFIDSATTELGFLCDTQVEVGLASIFSLGNIIEQNVVRLQRVSGSDTTTAFLVANDALYNDVRRNYFLFSAGVTECTIGTGTGNRYTDSAGMLQKQSSTYTQAPTAVAYISGAGVTAITDASLTTVPLNAELFDSHGLFDTGANEWVAIGPSPVQVSGHITLDNYVTGKYATLSIVVAGSTVISLPFSLTTNATDTVALTFCEVVFPAAGGAIKLEIITDSGTSANFKQGAAFSRVLFKMLT